MDTLEVVCGYCGRYIYDKESGRDEDGTSHGVCSVCSQMSLAKASTGGYEGKNYDLRNPNHLQFIVNDAHEHLDLQDQKDEGTIAKKKLWVEDAKMLQGEGRVSFHIYLDKLEAEKEAAKEKSGEEDEVLDPNSGIKMR